MQEIASYSILVLSSFSKVGFVLEKMSITLSHETGAELHNYKWYFSRMA